MTPAAATEFLTDVLASLRQGGTWRMIAVVYGLDSPQAAKKLAKEAARVSQAFLLQQMNAADG
jgi:hypothetical protein